MADNGRFKRLLEPLQVRQAKFRNRMVKPAQVTSFAEKDGSAGPRLLDFYEALARGGVGMIVIEGACPDYPIGGKGAHRLRVDDEAFVPSLAALAEVIHRHGCPTFLQITHDGPAHNALSGLQPVSASSFAEGEAPRADPRVGYTPPHGLTVPEIRQVVEKYAEAAWRARRAGFDGVEIHAAHPYLINSFLSRIWNRREDEYGCQSPENRARLALEVVRAVRERAGQDFAIGIRINGQEWGHERGITIEESSSFAKVLAAGGVDYISVSGWGYGRGPYSWVQYPEQLLYPEAAVPLARKVKKPGVMVGAAAAVKSAVPVPVITVGRLDPVLGEWILGKGMADAIALGRRLLADPDLPRKVAEGRPEDIRPCMGSLECRTRYQSYGPISCRVNAALGKEREYEIRPAAEKKRVVVVGGGPAGMEAARVAAARGHEVVLYEREPRLGGSLPLAALVKGTEIEDLPALVSYFETQLRKLGVSVKLGQEFRPELVEGLKPDVIVVATGGVAATPEIPGASSRNVLGSEVLHRRVKPYLRLLGPRALGWITRFWLPIGKRVVVIGGSMRGCQVAEFLIKRGRKVTIVEESDQLGEGLPDVARPRLLDWLAEKGATLLAEAVCEEVADGGLVIRTKDGGKQTIQADNVVVALPLEPNTKLAKELEGRVPEVHLVGDCREPQQIMQAIADGARIGNAV